MRWFKHLSKASEDEKLSEILDEFGPEGYGIYWLILERIAFLMEKGSDRTSARYSLKKWAKFCGKSPKVFRKFLGFFSKLSLFNVEICEKNSDFIIIECRNLLKYRDEYSKKSGQPPDNDRTNSGATPDQETETETELEKKLFVEKAFEKWWPTFPKRNGRRIGKKEAKTKFQKIDQNKWNNLKMATTNYCDYLKKSGLSAMDAHRFLSGKWIDYIEHAEHSEKKQGSSNEIPEELR